MYVPSGGPCLRARAVERGVIGDAGGGRTREAGVERSVRNEATTTRREKQLRYKSRRCRVAPKRRHDDAIGFARGLYCLPLTDGFVSISSKDSHHIIIAPAQPPGLLHHPYVSKRYFTISSLSPIRTPVLGSTRYGTLAPSSSARSASLRGLPFPTLRTKYGISSSHSASLTSRAN